MRSRKTERPGETVCLGAILKDEEPFVEEWIAHHRLLGVDHFYLYDNDPRQPLSDLLRLHRQYVTIRPWLVEHDDARYPGDTKQVKAYQHCLTHDAGKYDWVAFLDGDEFIALEEHQDLKAFLADFQRCDSIALNWHVFGHNGHYDNPPGLVIESLTRRMQEPRAITKSLSRPEAIASLGVHLCRLKKGRRRVDANKNSYREELYPGKSRRAHINHYQCRSFTHWMGKVERGEVGAFAGDPENAWRFSHEGCLRQFVISVTLNKNECIDTSAMRYAEPIKTYLKALRTKGGIDKEGLSPATAPSECAEEKRSDRNSGLSPKASDPGSAHSVKASILRFAKRQLARCRNRFLSVTDLRSPRGAMPDTVSAIEASLEHDWRRAETLWQALLDEMLDRSPPSVYRHLARAHRHLGNFGKAEELLRQGLHRYPKDVGLTADLAEIAIAGGNWREATRCAHTILETFESEPERVNERHIVAACRGLMGNREYAQTFAALENFKNHGRGSKSLLAIEGFAYLRSSRTEEARRHWAEYRRRGQDDKDFAAQRPPSTRPFFDLQHHGRLPALAQARGTVPAQGDERICVYTALFGGYDELRLPAYKPVGWDFICFSDQPMAAAGWDVRLVDLPGGSPAMKNRRLKILPYDSLSEYDYSLYLDSNVALLGDPSHLYRRWLRGEPFVAWRHPQRGSVFDELEAILASSRAEPSQVIDQYVFFTEQAVPDTIPMIEANFLWRDHRDIRVRMLMEQLWDHLTGFQTWRDQPGLAYLMWKTGIRPAVFPDHLGTSRDNEFTRKFAHKRLATILEEPKPSQALAANDKSSRAVTGRSSKPALIFVCREKFSAVASTLMRGSQLTEIARQRLDGKAEIGNVNELHLGEQRDSLLVLTKGFLKDATLDDLVRLKERGNIICVDYVDDPDRRELHEAIDVYIAASIRQFTNYAGTYPDKLVHLVSHHADPRLNGMQGPKGYCNVGYFGEIVNARHAAELQGKIDFCLIDTKFAEPSWIPRLSHCNVHYAVRNRRPIDGFKPFLKGFTAAHCHSNIIVSETESDAIYYLSSDYPYLLTDESLRSVLDMIDRVKASFGDEEWRRGLEIMESVRQRSSPQQIGSEIEALISLFR